MEAERQSNEEKMRQMKEKMDEEMRLQREEAERVMDSKLREQADLLEKSFKEKADRLRQEVEELKRQSAESYRAIEFAAILENSTRRHEEELAVMMMMMQQRRQQMMAMPHMAIRQMVVRSSDECQVKSSHLYLYSAFNNTNCDKATAQYQNGKIVSIM